MRSGLARAALTLSGLLFIIIVIGNVVIVAQEAVTGTWKADVRTEKGDKENVDKIHLSFTRRTQNGRNQNGSSFAYSDLQGLNREQAVADGKVNFRLVREAGTVDCEGSFADGRGTGTFRFTPDMSFVTAMRSRGFDFEKKWERNTGDESVSERLMAAAFINLTIALADDLNSANFGKLDVDDLFKAAIFKVDSKYMVEMKNSGFPDLKFEDLVKGRIFKIDAEYVKQVHEMGFSDHGFEGLVKFRIFKVTPEYLNELKAAGLSKMDSEDIVKCRIFKIDPEFVRKARATDPNLTVEDLVKMKIGIYRHKDKDSN